MHWLWGTLFLFPFRQTLSATDIVLMLVLHHKLPLFFVVLSLVQFLLSFVLLALLCSKNYQKYTAAVLPFPLNCCRLALVRAVPHLLWQLLYTLFHLLQNFHSRNLYGVPLHIALDLYSTSDYLW